MSATPTPPTDARVALDAHLDIAGRARRAIGLTRTQLRDQDALDRLVAEVPDQVVRHYLATLERFVEAANGRLVAEVAIGTEHLQSPPSELIRQLERHPEHRPG